MFTSITNTHIAWTMNFTYSGIKTNYIYIQYDDEEYF